MEDVDAVKKEPIPIRVFKDEETGEVKNAQGKVDGMVVSVVKDNRGDELEVMIFPEEENGDPDLGTELFHTLVESSSSDPSDDIEEVAHTFTERLSLVGLKKLKEMYSDDSVAIKEGLK